MHAILTITMLHDRVLAGESFKEQSLAEIYHWHQATAIFRKRLSGSSLTSSERDALWFTAVTLSTISLGSLDATTPEETWPLKTPESSSNDLNWLEIAHGKRVIWEVVEIERQDSVVRAMVSTAKDSNFNRSLDQGGLEVLPKELLEVLNLDADSVSPETNPYYNATACLGSVWRLEFNHYTIQLFYAWLVLVEGDFRQMLASKDPGALLLLAYWLAKVRNTEIWFLYQRSVLQCEAICIYLERNHADLPHLETLLRFPRGLGC